MEKFAVDLDKVLDDFEFNEDHSLPYASTSASVPTQYNYSLQNPQIDSTSLKLLPYSETDPVLSISHPESQDHQDDGNRYYQRHEVISNFTNTTPTNYNLSQTKKQEQSIEYFENDLYSTPNTIYSQSNVPTNFQPTNDIKTIQSNYLLNFEHYENNASVLKNVNSTTSQNMILRSDEIYENVEQNVYQSDEIFSTESLKSKLFNVVNKQPIVNYNIKTDTEEVKLSNSCKKHSVSNVFNSLHEYINTDVKNINNSQFAETDSSETLPDLIKTNNLDHKRHFQIIHNTLSEEPADTYLNDIDLSSKTVKVTNEMLNSNKTPLVDVFFVPKTSGLTDKINNVEKSIIDSQKSISETNTVELKNSSDNVKLNEESLESIQNNHNIDKMIKNSLEDEELSNDTTNIPVEEYQNINIDQPEMIQNESDDIKEIIGFDDNIDISDSEIDYYLDELEKENDLLDTKIEGEQNNIKNIKEVHEEVKDNFPHNSNENHNGLTANETREDNQLIENSENINEPIINKITEIKTDVYVCNEIEEVQNIDEDYKNNKNNNYVTLEFGSKESLEEVNDNTQIKICTNNIENIDIHLNESIINDTSLPKNSSTLNEIKVEDNEDIGTVCKHDDVNVKNGNINSFINNANSIENKTFKEESAEIEKNMTEKIKSEHLDDLSEEQLSNLQNESVIENDSLSNKRSLLCRPNSLDLAPNIYANNDDENIAPPGETPGITTDNSNVSLTNNDDTLENNITDTNLNNDNSSELNLADFSPSTSEVSSIENNDSLILDDQINNQTERNEFCNNSTLGKKPPYWIPDSETNFCMHCGFKFNIIHRRHHCRACGLVLCSKCCNMRLKLEYLGNVESRVCIQCFEILNKDVNSNNNQDNTSSDSANNSPAHATNHPNPNNPMEYCSTVPPLQQIENQGPSTPPSVMVPVGVLKRHGSTKNRSEKTVMFSDGIRPGCDLTELDNSWDSKPIRRQNKRVSTPPGPMANKLSRSLPHMDSKTMSYIPIEENCLPPTMTIVKADISYQECSNSKNVVEMLKNETLVFAIQRNFSVQVKIVTLDCCVNKQVWCFSTQGLSSVGQDEIVILLELLENEDKVPKDIFLHLNNIYNDASKGNTIIEMGFSIQNSPNFLGSKNHAGFLYVRPTYQCLQNILLPSPPYLIGILIHRWETPWVKIFPLRLLLRLGAEYRYYPCPITSTRNRESVYVEIGHTIINLLADFKNFSYTLPNVRGLVIHMEERKTSVLIPKNRYDQVMRALNNSSEHILAFAGNFSSVADSHLVCIQDVNGVTENGYSTHAINIQNKPREVTGASFIILNGALKTTSGLTAKSSIIEDGLMIQILPDQMVKLRESLRNMKPFQISCGCVNSESDEHVNLIWTENDINFNIGVKSPIDNRSMDGIPSIRVHNGADHIGSSRFIRWTEVFIIQSGEENSKAQDPLDISKLSENISKSTCQALVTYLDLLATKNFYKIAIRATLHSESVSYEAGSNGVKLAPIYMKSLDNELIPVLHKITSNNLGETPIVLELVFHILNV